MNELYTSITNESDLLYWLLQRQWTGEVFPRVTSIPKGDRITPDIDLLHINEYASPPELTGYEVKVLRKNDPLGPFYTAIGEALCYLRFGLDWAYVVIGCQKVPPGNVDRVQTTLKQIWAFLAEHAYLPPCLGLNIYRPTLSYPERIEPKYKFSASADEETAHRRRCLFKHQFGWGKDWLREYKKKRGLP